MPTTWTSVSSGAGAAFRICSDCSFTSRTRWPAWRRQSEQRIDVADASSWNGSWRRSPDATFRPWATAPPMIPADVALTLLAEQGFDATSMAQIAAATGLPPNHVVAGAPEEGSRAADPDAVDGAG